MRGLTFLIEKRLLERIRPLTIDTSHIGFVISSGQSLFQASGCAKF